MRDPVVADVHENLKHFSIDRSKATKSLIESGVTGKRLDRELQKIDRFNSVERSETSLFVVRDDYGRVHTNVTQLKKEVRECALSCDGKPVSEVDIKSSQGVLFCFLVAQIVAALTTGQSFILLVHPFDVSHHVGF